MNSKQRVDKALSLLHEQIEDEQLDPKDRQTAAKAILTYFKQSSTVYKGKGNDTASTAVEAAQKFKRVK